jgi:hypothetical protein
MPNTHKKITIGYVVQDYTKLSNGTLVCTGQEFIAGEVSYEDSQYGEEISIDTSKEVYCPFEMTQPKHIPFPAESAVKGSYENGMCPDCGYEIPNDVQDGDKCANCPHVFYDETEDNSDITDPNAYIDPRYTDDNADITDPNS